MSLARISAHRHRQGGSSLIEVLVSLVVLAIGLLGMSGMLTSSLKSNQSAYIMTQATFHSQDIAERMRANPAGVAQGSYHGATPALNAGCLSAAGCSAAEMAAHDVAEWQASVGASLPSPVAVLCLDSDPSDGTPAAPACDGAGDIYAIKLWWDDDRDGTPEQKYVMSFRP